MSTEDAPFSRTQATWAHAGEDCENYKTVIVLLSLHILFCYIFVSS